VKASSIAEVRALSDKLADLHDRRRSQSVDWARTPIRPSQFANDGDPFELLRAPKPRRAYITDTGKCGKACAIGRRTDGRNYAEFRSEIPD
jgi:hypothetical protein